MSDDDFMQESDQEEYDFEYEDDDEEQDGDVDIENKYYNAKQTKADYPEEAVAEFLGVRELEQEKGDWWDPDAIDLFQYANPLVRGFKGLKQAIKLEFKLKQYDKVYQPIACSIGLLTHEKPQATEHYQELLTYVKSAVTRNYSEKSINNMLDYIEKGSEDEGAYRCMERFYSLTLSSFQSTNNERLWLKTNIKLAKLWLDRREYGLLTKKLRELHKACQKEDGTDDPSKGTYLLEVYALEIQISAVPHPKIMENWNEAQSDFFESFRNYDEAGSLQRIQVLKYLVLTTMLMKSDINPFDSQETKPYKNDPRIAAMTDLVDAYQRDDIHKYESILQSNQDTLADPFISENIDEVTRNMRTKAVLKLVAPYTRFTLAFVSKQLNISVPEVEDIIGFLIVDQKMRGKVNQQDGTVEIDNNSDTDRMHSMSQWIHATHDLWSTVLHEGEGFKYEDPLLPGQPGLVSYSSAGDFGSSQSSRATANLGKSKGLKGKGVAGKLLGLR
ncbi:MAG: hypothetical protein M1819_003720 [Sarea resinae]|nr:MAG: hypothetical protein M1819_003720 [Sarea resinae]